MKASLWNCMVFSLDWLRGCRLCLSNNDDWPRTPLTVLAIDRVQRLFHLAHILGTTVIQGFLHHRLLGTAAASERFLQSWVGSQAGVDFDQPVGSCQQTDKGIVDFVNRRMLDRLLSNPHRLANGTKHVQLPQLYAQRGQTRTSAKLFRWLRGRLVLHDDPPISDFILFDRYASSSFFWQVLSSRHHAATSLDKI